MPSGRPEAERLAGALRALLAASRASWATWHVWSRGPDGAMRCILPQCPACAAEREAEAALEGWARAAGRSPADDAGPELPARNGDVVVVAVALTDEAAAYRVGIAMQVERGWVRRIRALTGPWQGECEDHDWRWRKVWVVPRDRIRRPELIRELTQAPHDDFSSLDEARRYLWPYVLVGTTRTLEGGDQGGMADSDRSSARGGR